ncbi:MAG: pyridoxamine 5'-phosphate oxidase family protein [Dehalococcoidia bacterium]|nr:pyridoxamine 5'-phosphate oxidase family protein [Dehalococcoidia bacterium]
MADWPRFDEDGKQLNEEGERFLNEHTRKGILITNGRDGRPHAVPLVYFRVGDDLYMAGRRRSQRLANIARDPKVSFLVEDGETMATFQGLLVQGDAEVIGDDAEKLRIARAAAEQRGDPEGDWPTTPPPGTLIRITPRRYISWDNSRVQR